MNLETPEETRIFEELARARTTDQTSMIGAVMTIDVNLLDLGLDWARNIVRNKGTIAAWLMPRNGHQPILDIEEPKRIRNEEDLEKMIRTAEAGIETFAVLGMITRRYSLPRAADDLMEAARAVINLKEEGLIVQAVCRNMAGLAEDQDDNLVNIYLDEMDIVLQIGYVSTPDINSIMHREEEYTRTIQHKIHGTEPTGFPEVDPHNVMINSGMNVN